MQSEQHTDQPIKTEGPFEYRPGAFLALGIGRMVSTLPNGIRELNADGCDVVEAYGVRISTAVFHFFADDANKGSTFRYVSREDGVLTIRRES